MQSFALPQILQGFIQVEGGGEDETLIYYNNNMVFITLIRPEEHKSTSGDMQSRRWRVPVGGAI